MSKRQVPVVQPTPVRVPIGPPVVVVPRGGVNVSQKLRNPAVAASAVQAASGSIHAASASLAAKSPAVQRHSHKIQRDFAVPTRDIQPVEPPPMDAILEHVEIQTSPSRKALHREKQLPVKTPVLLPSRSVANADHFESNVDAGAVRQLTPVTPVSRSANRITKERVHSQAQISPLPSPPSQSQQKAPPPQNVVIVEKWLPTEPQRRRVIYNVSRAPAPPNPHNVVVEWSQPPARIERVHRDLGVVDVDPEEYRRMYADELRDAIEIERLHDAFKKNNIAEGKEGGKSRRKEPVRQLPEDLEPEVELEGDLEILKRLDLDKLGLGHYKRYSQMK